VAANPETLVKYTDADTAKKIIGSGTLRWSSPELFHDPWELKLSPDLGFDENAINDGMLHTASSLVFAKELPHGDVRHPLYKAIRRWRLEDRFHDEEEAVEALSELLSATPKFVEGRLKSIMEAWSALVTYARVICLAESHQNLLSWERYGSNHHGVALRFLSGHGGTLANPHSVSYATHRPQITSIKEQVDDLVGLKELAGPETFVKKMLMKSKKDASEREWRCIKVMAEDELDCGEDVQDWYCDEPFKPSELRAVYFGFAIDPKVRNDIITVLKKTYKGVALFQGCRADREYEVNFQRMTVQ